ncbi:hypothetical protein pipiens_007156 [Culex pipiens pipiens]|uniref:Small-subunit processome Utp12 domain-containing protein n=1 Tax=Culex pipiens pipiens TaxID=38569 RepID=A0ABD1DLY8_CULPP
MNEPEQYISALLREISTLMQQKTVHVVTAVSWLKALIHSHTSQLMMLGSENLLANFGTCLGIIEYRVQHANSLSKFTECRIGHARSNNKKMEQNIYKINKVD